MLEDRRARQAVADALWSAMVIQPDLPAGGSRVRETYRTRLYGPLVSASLRRVSSHRSPEPFLTARCFLQMLTGDGWRRSERRYEGLIGGSMTEREYRDLAEGRTGNPLILVAGYPRSGTTSLQTLVRVAFPTHICELETEGDRFSLWEYPKHTASVAAQVADAGGGQAAILAAVRPFVDSAASLVVGRGGRDRVDLETERESWEDWLPVYGRANVLTLPFEALSRSTPANLSDILSDLLGIPAEVPVPRSATYASLMRDLGKGVVDDPKQSNVPSPARRAELADARAWVEEQLGAQEVARLASAYSAIPFSIDPAGTVEPR